MSHVSQAVHRLSPPPKWFHFTSASSPGDIHSSRLEDKWWHTDSWIKSCLWLEVVLPGFYLLPLYCRCGHWSEPSLQGYGGAENMRHNLMFVIQYKFCFKSCQRCHFKDCNISLQHFGAGWCHHEVATCFYVKCLKSFKITLAICQFSSGATSGRIHFTNVFLIMYFLQSTVQKTVFYY